MIVGGDNFLDNNAGSPHPNLEQQRFPQVIQIW